MIPKIIHYVWVGGKPLPTDTVAYIDSWRKYNPDYELKLWNERNIDFTLPYIKTAYKHQRWANIANLVRFQVLYNHGGIYLDTDVEVRRSFDPLLKHAVFCGFHIEPRCEDWVNNAVLGAMPRHDFVKKASSYISQVYDGMEDPNVSSPRLMTTLLTRIGLTHYSDNPVRIKDIEVYPCRYFYPYNWLEEPDEARITPDTYTIHYGAQSWRSYASADSISERLRHRKYRSKAALYRFIGRL